MSACCMPASSAYARNMWCLAAAPRRVHDALRRRGDMVRPDRDGDGVSLSRARPLQRRDVRERSDRCVRDVQSPVQWLSNTRPCESLAHHRVSDVRTFPTQTAVLSLRLVSGPLASHPRHTLRHRLIIPFCGDPLACPWRCRAVPTGVMIDRQSRPCCLPPLPGRARAAPPLRSAFRPLDTWSRGNDWKDPCLCPYMPLCFSPFLPVCTFPRLEYT
jgi:hypothetical protein